MTTKSVEVEGVCKIRAVNYSIEESEGGWVELETCGVWGSEIIELDLCVWNSPSVMEMFNAFGGSMSITPRVRVTLEWED